MADLRVLFVSRKYPPSIGGMEQLSYHLIQNARGLAGVQVQAIVWRHSQRWLPLFILKALFQSIWICRRGIDVVHIGDPVLALLGLILKSLFHVPIAITVHGLDITFSMPFYQALVPGWVKRYDKVICISRLAFKVSIERGISERQSVIIYPGVEAPRISGSKLESREALSRYTNCDWSKAKMLLTVGRLIPRKGVFFFVDQVMPQLVKSDPAFVYMIVGTGPDRERIAKAVEQHRLKKHVCLTGYLSPDLLWQAYNASDLFVAPNVPQPYDVEGFGLIVLEAAATGCPVLISDLEGLRDTIPAKSGSFFLPAGEPEPWQQQITVLFNQPDRLITAGEKARAFVLQQRTWPVMAENYIIEFRKMVIDD